MKKLLCVSLTVLFVLNILNASMMISARELKVEAQDETQELPTETISIEVPTKSLNRDVRVIATEQDRYEYEFEKRKQAEYQRILEEQEQQEEVITDDTNGTMAYASTEVISPYEGEISRYTDLRNRIDISADQMNEIINYWVGDRDSEFINEGQSFITASNNTGLDPIFLLALAANESGWEVSDLHSGKNNPYSINMIDSDPYAGYTMGDEFAEGIINGAIWINDYYYDQGQTTLDLMIYGGKCYSSSADKWIADIESIMNTSYKYILNY